MVSAVADAKMGCWMYTIRLEEVVFHDFIYAASGGDTTDAISGFRSIDPFHRKTYV